MAEDGPGAGRNLRRRNIAILVGAAALVLVDVLRLSLEMSGAALVVSIAGSLGFAFAVGWLLIRASRRRSQVAATVGAFGSSSSVQITQLRQVPRFAPLLSDVRKTGFTGGWIGGGVVINREGVTWTPTAYSQRKRGMPTLHVSWTEVKAAKALKSPGIFDPGVLELQLCDGSAWAMNVSGYRRLQAALDNAPVVVEP